MQSHIETQSFSAVASQSFDNVFTSAYDNYLINMELQGSTTLNIRFRFRNNTTDNSNSNYYLQRLGANSTTPVAAQANATNIVTLQELRSDRPGHTILNITNPLANARTGFFANTNIYHTNMEVNFFTGNLYENYVANGISIIASTGNITGTISIYGYGKA